MSKKRNKKASKRSRASKNNSGYVRNSRRAQKEAKRMSIAMRVLTFVIILALVAVFSAFIIWYIIPFMQSEMAAGENVASLSSEVSRAESAVPRYDENGLEVYDDDINLVLVNSKNRAVDTDAPETESVNGVPVEKKIAGAARYLVEAAKNDGLMLEFESGYISYHEQEALFNAEVDRLMEEENDTLVMAREDAKENVATAGSSDFQTGMCIRLKADAETFQTSQTYEWLSNNMAQYGFVFRFPENKEKLTEHKTDYTVIRYVGRQNAEKMTQLSMCLEEYKNYVDEQRS